MSLTSYVKRPEVVARLKPLRPKGRRTLNLERKVSPRTRRFMLIGVAFDYLLRFEIQRLNPHANASSWVAERALELVRHESDDGSLIIMTPMITHEGMDVTDSVDPLELARSIETIIKEAKVVHQTYVKTSAPSDRDRSTIAGHAIKLAHLDPIARSRRLSAEYQKVDDDDVEDLVNMLNIAPVEDLLSGRHVILNPVLGGAAPSIGGADADLIVDNLLVDVKTVSKAEIKADFLDQLLGYYLLARRLSDKVGAFASLSSAGFYFSRHGFLWQTETEEWTQHPEFLAVEEWFFNHASELNPQG